MKKMIKVVINGKVEEIPPYLVHTAEDIVLEMLVEGKTQREVAKALGISQTTVSRIKRGCYDDLGFTLEIEKKK